MSISFKGRKNGAGNFGQTGGYFRYDQPAT